jgi:predicted secreted protein
VASSARVCWWRCSTQPEHEWRAGIRERTRGQTMCPYCSHKRVSQEASLALRHPALAAEWHPTKNGRLSPNEVTLGSNRAVWWLCSSNPEHCWRATVSNRVGRASGCPRCARRRLPAWT